MSRIVMKFGGTSVGSVDRIKNVSNIVQSVYDEGHEVVGDALGVLADAAGRVRAHGVEVPQEHHLPIGLGVLKVGEDVLDEELGAAVGVERRGGEVLGARDRRGLAVNGRGRREDHGLAPAERWERGTGGQSAARKKKAL